MRTIILLVALALPHSASSFVSELASGLRLRTGLRPRPAVRALTPQSASTSPLPASICRPVPRGTLLAIRTVAEQLIVTDGTDSFFASRLIFQSVHDHGDYSKITAFSALPRQRKPCTTPLIVQEAERMSVPRVQARRLPSPRKCCYLARRVTLDWWTC